MVVLTLLGGELHAILIDTRADAGVWSLPGGFMHRGESAERAAYRHLEEVVGLGEHDVVLDQLRTYSEPGRQPHDSRVVSVGWVVLGAQLPQTAPSARTTGAQWIPVDVAFTMPLAFDHADILRDGVERARARLEYTNLATAFLPPEFTMSELRGVYEAVWGGHLEPANFHRKVLSVPGFVVETGHARHGRGRPAKLYRAGPTPTINPPLTRVSVREQASAR